MAKIFIIQSLIILNIYLGVGSLFFVKQRGFLYFPTPAISHKYSETTFKHDGEELKVISLMGSPSSSVIANSLFKKKTD